MRTPSSNIPLAACCLGNPHSGGAVTKNSRVRESIWDAEPKQSGSGDRHGQSRVPTGRQSRQNRLIEVLDDTASSDPITGVTNLVSCQYGRLARLVARTTTAATTNYLYDGWNRIAEYSIQNSTFTIQNSYLWGLDLSGSMQGAGGVGGLLATRWPSYPGSPTYYPQYDGNGNITEYLTSGGAVAAHFEYDPFGTLTRLTGSNSTRFQYRFSTKPRDINTGLYYYGYRWYDPLTGRWPSRDPIGEEGGVNLYGFVNNDCTDRFDMLGLIEVPIALDPDVLVREHLDSLQSIIDCPDSIAELLKQEPYAKLLQQSSNKNGRCRVVVKCVCDNNRAGDNETKRFLDVSEVVLRHAKGASPPPATLLHELVHARDYCDGWVGSDCRSQVCTELKAYSASNPQENPGLWAMMSDDLKKNDIIDRSAGSAANKCGGKKRAIEIGKQIWDECVGNGNIY